MLKRYAYPDFQLSNVDELILNDHYAYLDIAVIPGLKNNSYI